MPSPLVLVLTHTGDHFTVDRVERALVERGARARRLCTDRFPLALRLSSRLGPGGPRHRARDAEGELDPSEVAAVWARRVVPPALDPALDERFREGAARESTAALLAFLDALDGVPWIHRRDVERRAADKARQLRLAADLGLRTPRTLITNDPAEARAFHAEVGGDAVAKLLTPLSSGMGKAPLFVRTSPVSAEDLEDAELLAHCPMVFQERIEKRLELRVVLVGDRTFAGGVDASSSAQGRTDWRAAAPDEVRWRRAEVPADVEAGLHALRRALGLVFAAADVVATPGGDHVLLELNPGGEWGMLERELELPISGALADLLLDEGLRG